MVFEAINICIISYKSFAIKNSKLSLEVYLKKQGVTSVLCSKVTAEMFVVVEMIVAETATVETAAETTYVRGICQGQKLV